MAIPSQFGDEEVLLLQHSSPSGETYGQLSYSSIVGLVLLGFGLVVLLNQTRFERYPLFLTQVRCTKYDARSTMHEVRCTKYDAHEERRTKNDARRTTHEVRRTKYDARSTMHEVRLISMPIYLIELNFTLYNTLRTCTPPS